MKLVDILIYVVGLPCVATDPPGRVGWVDRVGISILLIPALCVCTRTHYARATFSASCPLTHTLH